MRVRVRAKGARLSFDGQTGVCVLAQTVGTVAALTLQPVQHTNGLCHQKLTVWWDVALVQDRENKDATDEYEGWEESGVDPHDLVFIGIEGTRPSEQEAGV